MPKNQFQRPLPIQHTQNVPRHGKAQPARKVEPKRVQPLKDVAPMPGLQDLLRRPSHQ